MSRRCSIGLSALVLFIASAARAAVVLPAEKASGDSPVTFAAGDLRAAIKAAGVDPEKASVTVQVALTRDFRPEGSFKLDVSGESVLISSHDDTGLMYGQLELAEQLANAPAAARGDWAKLVAAVKPTSQQPFLALRADNPFIQCTAGKLVFDVPMWKAYIDMLARNRYNQADIHGGYDINATSFPNIYPLMITVPDYPQVGDAAQQKKNLDDFRAIIAHAKGRGVRVSFMNYSTGGIPGIDPRRNPQDYPRLVDYTAKAVAILIKELPELYEMGFRVGESGQPAAFHKDAYLKGVEMSGRKDLRLYTRSWRTKQEELEPIAVAAPNNFDIEIKYNGEQLGLPYQAMQGRSYGSYSYEGYIQANAPYKIIWQTRANGTHRFFAWADTRYFIPRCIRTMTLGDALGYTLEPHWSYFTPYAKEYYQKAEDQGVHEFIWQKHWMWYFGWGRLGYNPDLPEQTVVGAYRQHYGEAAGEAAYKAMQAASPIVPLVYAFRRNGPDHRDLSPETEAGLMRGRSNAPTANVLPGFIRCKAMDDRSFASIDEFVNQRIKGEPDGRISPLRVANILEQHAGYTRKMVERGDALAKDDGPWRLLRTDLLSASHLGDYYAREIRGLTHLDYADKTGSTADYEEATRMLASAREAWQKLADTADPVYGELNNPLRGQRKFKWAGELAKIDLSLGEPARMFAATQPSSSAKPLAERAQDEGEDLGIRASNVLHTIAGDPQLKTITVRAKVSAKNGVAAAVLWHKPLPTTTAWTSTPMTIGDDGIASATVPLLPVGILYLIEVKDKTGAAQNLPDVLSETPYHAVTPQDLQRQGVASSAGRP